jgi:hypothetical protein
MTLTILVAASALIMAALFGALLAPSDRSIEREFQRSQWMNRLGPNRLAPIALSSRRSGCPSGKSNAR